MSSKKKKGAMRGGGPTTTRQLAARDYVRPHAPYSRDDLQILCEAELSLISLSDDNCGLFATKLIKKNQTILNAGAFALTHEAVCQLLGLTGRRNKGSTAHIHHFLPNDVVHEVMVSSENDILWCDIRYHPIVFVNSALPGFDETIGLRSNCFLKLKEVVTGRTCCCWWQPETSYLAVNYLSDTCLRDALRSLVESKNCLPHNYE
jgi:hypothetical protein